ncbi:pentatricopeptide repeat-containing protein At4g39530 [Nymphaea colorata]|nr:pentatricopeptide repeat-containing protein At4g39530 [Nymphaea colorata]
MRLQRSVPLPIKRLSCLCSSYQSSRLSFPVHSFGETRQELATFLQSCAATNSSMDGKKAHGRTVLLGLLPDIFLENIILNVYSKTGCFREARQLFDGMRQRNLISWSTIISGFAQHGRGEEALLLYSQFQATHEKPNQFVLASVLRACSGLGAVEEAAQLHDYAIKAGLYADVFVGTALIDVYTKNCYIEEARLVFEELPVKNAVSWTAIIAGYSLVGRSEVSIELFSQMVKTDLQPDRYVLSSVISACSVLSLLDHGKQIHAYITRKQCELDVLVTNVLIDMYSKCSQLSIARKLFNQMVVRNVVSWTTMIAGYMQNSFDWDALLLFSMMNRQGWRPDGYTCTASLNSCGALEDFSFGQQIHCYTIKANIVQDEYVNNGLVDMYSKCNSVADARKIFDAMINYNVVSFNAMIEGYAQQGELQEVVDLFNQMRWTSVKLSLLTFVSVLGASLSSTDLWLSRQIHVLMIKEGMSLDLYAGSALVDVYSKSSNVDDARSVFEEMQERDIVVWNAMVSGYAQNANGEEALKLLIEMQHEGMVPDKFTYVAGFISASQLASLLHGSQLHNHVMKNGLDSEPFVSNALLDMYAKCGSIQDARKLFDAISSKDVVCWNSIISCYAQHGHAFEAFVMFEKMQETSIEPNYVTFVGILSACSHAGLIETGLRHFHSMKHKFNIEPGIEHYVCMVDLLGRAGKLDEVKLFLEQLPIVPDAVMLRSLLSACRKFGDINLAKHTAELAIATDPRDSGSRIMLSNMFASAGMWADVEKIRKGMNHSGIVKETGYSWIEVKNEVNAFVAKDKTHGQGELIYSVLGGLTLNMKSIGYVPDTVFLWHD